MYIRSRLSYYDQPFSNTINQRLSCITSCEVSPYLRPITAFVPPLSMLVSQVRGVEVINIVLDCLQRIFSSRHGRVPMQFQLQIGALLLYDFIIVRLKVILIQSRKRQRVTVKGDNSFEYSNLSTMVTKGSR